MEYLEVIALFANAGILWVLGGKIEDVLKEVKKGNKDQQEIKTKLTNLRQSTDKHAVDIKKQLKPKKK